MAKKTPSKPKRSIRNAVKPSKRKARSKRLRSRGRRMSDKALSRSRSKQKKSKRRGKILRGGAKSQQKDNRPRRAIGASDEHRTARSAGQIAKSHARSGRKKLRGVTTDPRFQEMRAKTAPAMWDKAMQGVKRHSRIKKRVAQSQAEMPSVRNVIRRLPVDPVWARQSAPEVAQIAREYAAADAEEEAQRRTYLENAALRALRGFGAPVAATAANVLEDPMGELGTALNYARLGLLTLPGGQQIEATAGAAAEAGAETAAVAAQVAISAAERARQAAIGAINAAEAGRATLARNLRDVGEGWTAQDQGDPRYL